MDLKNVTSDDFSGIIWVNRDYFGDSYACEACQAAAQQSAEDWLEAKYPEAEIVVSPAYRQHGVEWEAEQEGDSREWRTIPARQYDGITDWDCCDACAECNPETVGV